MQDPTQPEPYVQEDYSEPEPPKRRMSGWLIALIVILVLIIACCCVVVLVYLFFAPTVGNTFSTIIQTIEVYTPAAP
jgi:flagellar basal body-associated protein FliL